MLIDFVPIDKLPFVVVWLDWAFFAYKIELFVSMTISAIYFYIDKKQYTEYISLANFDYPLVMLIGFALWVVFCALRQGVGVG